MALGGGKVDSKNIPEIPCRRRSKEKSLPFKGGVKDQHLK